ncbi:MAG: HPr family phosphocarrier protein [Clostridiales bacterium]|nr:HPr family phosphocarrier protein [Clostridiales bacterium]
MVRTDAVFSAADRMTPEIAVSLARLAEKFTADLTIGYDTTSIQLDSLIGVLSLDLRRGKSLWVLGNGTDEAEAVDAICKALTVG